MILLILLSTVRDLTSMIILGVKKSCIPMEAFEGVQYAFLIGGFPRLAGMLRKDLIAKNTAIFSETGKAIDAVAVIVIIPESNLGMFKQVLSKPVIIPHIAPTIKAIIVEVKGSTPFTIKVRHTAPPIRKLPSAVKSAKSNSL